MIGALMIPFLSLFIVATLYTVGTVIIFGNSSCKRGLILKSYICPVSLLVIPVCTLCTNIVHPGICISLVAHTFIPSILVSIDSTKTSLL